MTPSYRPPDYQVDILIRGWGGLDLTRRLLASVAANTDPALYRVTYVDNGSELMHVADLVADYPDLTLVRLPFNHGSVRAINAGLQLAWLSPAPFVLLLDNDTEIPKGDSTWLERWIEYFDNPHVGAAGAVTDYVSGMQQAEAVPDRYQKDWRVGAEHGEAEPAHLPLLVSFGLMLRKAFTQTVGLFDERYEPGNCEDYDYSLRLAEAGYRNVIAESVWLHHKGSQTFRKLDFAGLLRDNNAALVEKFGAERLKVLGVAVRTRSIQ